MAKAKKKEILLPVEEQPYQIPENWYWTRIENISEIVSKGTTPKGGKDAYIEEGVKFLRVENFLDDGTISHEGIAHVAYDVHEGFLKRSILQENDVLVSIAGTLGKTAIIQKEDLPINTNQAVAFIRINPKMKVLPTYLRYSLANPAIQNHLLGKTKVTSIPNLTLEIISSCPVPVPPLAEQQRIVEQIESLFAKLDETKDKLQEALDSYQRRKMSLLYKAYNGELTGGWRTANGIDLNSWSTVTINDISDVKGGKRVPKGMELVTENTGQPYIKAGNLKQGTVIDDGIMYVPDEVYKYIKNYTVKTGDVYITNVGACIGDCGVIPEKYDGANLTENAVKMTNLKCDSDFLALYLETSAVQQMIKGLIASATLGKLSIANIKTIEINLPSMDEQKEIVKIVKEILVKEDITKEQIVKVVQQVDLMKKSILAKAFRGELGTNNPAEESAVEFLKSMLEQEG